MVSLLNQMLSRCAVNRGKRKSRCPDTWSGLSVECHRRVEHLEPIKCPSNRQPSRVLDTARVGCPCLERWCGFCSFHYNKGIRRLSRGRCHCGVKIRQQSGQGHVETKHIRHVIQPAAASQTLRKFTCGWLVEPAQHWILNPRTRRVQHASNGA